MSKIYERTQDRFYIKSSIGALLVNTQPDSETVSEKEKENVLVVTSYLLNNDIAVPRVAVHLLVRLPTFITAQIKQHELTRLVINSPVYGLHGKLFTDRHQQYVMPVVVALSNEMDLDVTEIEFNLTYTKEEVDDLLREHHGRQFNTGYFHPENPFAIPSRSRPFADSFGQTNYGSKRNGFGPGQANGEKPADDTFNAHAALHSGGTVVLI